jgi:hypothetical protein
VEAVAKLALGLIFVALFIQMMKGGPDAAKMWLRAKFLGEAA